MVEMLDWNIILTIYIQGAAKFPQYDALNFSSGATDGLNYLKTVMSAYKAPNGANWGGYANPKVDELALRALNSTRGPYRPRYPVSSRRAAGSRTLLPSWWGIERPAVLRSQTAQTNWPSLTGMSRSVPGTNSSSTRRRRGVSPCSCAYCRSASIEGRFASIP